MSLADDPKYHESCQPENQGQRIRDLEARLARVLAVVEVLEGCLAETDQCDSHNISEFWLEQKGKLAKAVKALEAAEGWK